MDKTSYINLNKPNYNEWADIDDLNQNSDLIDNKFRSVDENINNNKGDIDTKLDSTVENTLSLDAEETKTITPKVSSLINPTFQGAFRQNLIDTHKCIYRMDGDNSPIPIDITDNSMKVMSYSNSYLGTGCFVGVVTGKEYTVKTTSVDPSTINIFDADGLTRSNASSKRIITSSNKTSHNFKFTAPSSGYVFVTFAKYGSDTTGTTVYNPICIEGDYTSRNIEWVKGTAPSMPVVNVSGENLFDLNKFISDKTNLGYYSLTSSGSLSINSIDIRNPPVREYDSYKINVKPNTVYTLKTTGSCQFRVYGLNKKEAIYESTPAINELQFNAGSNDEIMIKFVETTTFPNILSDIMLTEGATAPTEYIPHKNSQFKLNNWLGNDEIYENGLVNKQWGRVLLSEAYDGLVNISVDFENVYRFYINLKENYRGSSSATSSLSYFKDYFYNSDFVLDAKHQYFYYSDWLNVNRFLLFISKAEIDSLTGSTLEEKFKSWVEINDDYIYYKKSSSETIKASTNSIGGIFANELNTISNVSYGTCSFKYGESINKALDNIVDGLKLNVEKPEEKEKVINLYDVTFRAFSWVLEADGYYSYTMSNDNISKKDIVNVNFTKETYQQAKKAGIWGLVESDYGKFTIFANKVPTGNFISADVTILKGGE